MDRAAEVAQAAQARLVVVTAYRDDDDARPEGAAEGVHRDLHGADVAREALSRSPA
uniref:hypothetical protein n=1 Tax=Paractinoplanes polyasparticus TaxID=2856853 RepID=UPI001C85F2FF|nr:hypothetical protein [Actinoplanes polyasparticus]